MPKIVGRAMCASPTPHSRIETIFTLPSLLDRRKCTMAGPGSLLLEPVYDILIGDADGRHLWLECLQDLVIARQRLSVLAGQYPGTRLVLRDHKTRAVLAETDDYYSTAPLVLFVPPH